jgi:HSP20 family molecular chaperone IbpA
VAQPAKAMAVGKQTKAPQLHLVPPADLFKRAEQLYERISNRAFEIFDSNGRQFGHDHEDWFKAEAELLHPMHLEVAESSGELTVRAEVPGFTSKELEIALNPRRLTITGKRQVNQERKEEKTIYTEITSDQVLRIVELPAAVDPEKAASTLRDGILILKMPKAAQPKKLLNKTKETDGDEQC